MPCDFRVVSFSLRCFWERIWRRVTRQSVPDVSEQRSGLRTSVTNELVAWRHISEKKESPYSDLSLSFSQM